jgi:V/A-type H+-transporting ATPase subunit C
MKSVELLRFDELQALAQAESKDALLQMLKETVYGKELAEAESSDLREVERSLSKTFAQALDGLFKGAPKCAEPLLLQLPRKFEAANLKIILRAKVAKLSPEETLDFTIPVGKLSEKALTALAYARDLTDLVDSVERLRLIEYRWVLREAIREYRKRGLLVFSEAILDRFAFQSVWDVTGKLRREDKLATRELIGTEVDIANLKILLRSAYHELMRECRGFFIPIYHRLGKFVLDKSLSARGLGEVIRSISIYPYAEILTQVLSESGEKSVLPYELALDDLLVKASEQVFTRYMFNVVVAIGFLNLKWAELRNLRAIIKCKEEGLPLEAVSQILLRAA